MADVGGRSSFRLYFAVANVNLELGEIASVLDQPWFKGTERGPSWEDVLRGATTSGDFGEARVDEDLQQIPDGPPVMLMWMTDARGETLRWLVDGSLDAEKALGGSYFESLERGESRGTPYAGEMVRDGQRAEVWSRRP
jgi:hypothetical protein